MEIIKCWVVLQFINGVVILKTLHEAYLSIGLFCPVCKGDRGVRCSQLKGFHQRVQDVAIGIAQVHDDVFPADISEIHIAASLCTDEGIYRIAVYGRDGDVGVAVIVGQCLCREFDGLYIPVGGCDDRIGY